MILLKASFGAIMLLKVIVGDTIKVNLDPCVGDPLFTEQINIRVANIDTPELYGCDPMNGKIAKTFVEQVLGKAKMIDLRQCVRDKYFRLVCHVYADGKHLGDQLLEAGLAVRYGKKWECK